MDSGNVYGNDWEQLQAACSPVSYWDPHARQWVTGSFEGNPYTTAVKSVPSPELCECMATTTRDTA